MKPACLALPLILACGATASAADRTIEADLSRVKGPRSMVWQDCVGAGRVGEGLRDGWRRQLEICHRELGFKYLRMHGLLHDELGVYSEDRDGNPRYNWQYIDDVYDFLLDTGMKPFVEIGFMPNALASGQATVFWWKGNITPPKDYAKWDALVKALVKHWTDRYGAEEVKTWRFEIWNEPNLSMFWRPPRSNQAKETYFELYEHTARAIASVNPDYIIGGPSGAGPVWTNDLIELCQEKKLPLGFTSFHSYGLGGGPSGLDQFGNQKTFLSQNLRYVVETVNSQNPIIEKSRKPKLPVHITEWSASYTPRDPIHDSYFSAPFILEQLRGTESVASMSYWTFTDVFEENGIAARPFHGGFGMINYQFIRKPSFWAYQFLSQLGPTEVQNADASSFVCTDGKGGVQILLWDLTNPIAGRIANQEFFFKPHPAKEKGSMTVKLSGLKAGNYRLATSRIGYRQNDPFSKYLEMGMPSDLSREQVADLKKLSTGRPVSETQITTDGTYATTFTIEENSVHLLTLTPLAN